MDSRYIINDGRNSASRILVHFIVSCVSTYYLRKKNNNSSLCLVKQVNILVVNMNIKKLRYTNMYLVKNKITNMNLSLFILNIFKVTDQIDTLWFKLKTGFKTFV